MLYPKEMKYFTLCTLMLFLVSCSDDPKVVAISDYVQTFENTKTDLGFDMLEFQKIGELKGVDSARIIHESRWKDPFNPDSNLFEQFDISHKEMYDDAVKYDRELDSMIDEEKDLSLQIILLEQKQASIDRKYESQSEWIKWSAINNKYKKYQSIGDSVMYDLYRIKYKIRNPFLDAVQEVVDTFYFYPGTDNIAFQK